MVLKIYLDLKQKYGEPISAYTAPELLKYEKGTVKIDVYSFGIIFWELLSRKKPFNHNTTDQSLPYMILKGKRPNLNEMKQHKFNEIMRVVIELCWNEVPNRRPTLTD